VPAMSGSRSWRSSQNVMDGFGYHFCGVLRSRLSISGEESGLTIRILSGVMSDRLRWK
jgi:hypothetical protein